MRHKTGDEGIMSMMSTVGAGSENITGVGIFRVKEISGGGRDQIEPIEVGTQEFSDFAGKEVEKITDKKGQVYRNKLISLNNFKQSPVSYPSFNSFPQY